MFLRLDSQQNKVNFASCAQFLKYSITGPPLSIPEVAKTMQGEVSMTMFLEFLPLTGRNHSLVNGFSPSFRSDLLAPWSDNLDERREWPWLPESYRRAKRARA